MTNKDCLDELKRQILYLEREVFEKEKLLKTLKDTYLKAIKTVDDETIGKALSRDILPTGAH